MNNSLQPLFARLEVAVAETGPVALMNAAIVSDPAFSELEHLVSRLGRDAYVCDAPAANLIVGATLAVIGFRIASGVLAERGDPVFGEDLLDLVEAHRWTDELPAPVLAVADLAVLLVAVSLRIDAAQLEEEAGRESFAVGVATAAVFANLAGASG